MATKQKDDLAARIEKVKADCDAYIQGKAEELKKTCPGIPIDVLRQTISGRGQCLCGIAQHLIEQEGA